ncbi:MAG: hypothetical protein EZS28_032831, partial [Streblomastix strix]
AGDDNLYNYILNWIAFDIQNAGVKSEVALILQGSQGIGKNRFTDVLCELLSGYSIKNITDISEFTGQFNSVVENIILGIANELKNFGEARYSNMDALTSIITDDSIRINEKNQQRRTSENVMNLIMVTNNDFPIKIEANDRRYVVCRCKAVHRDDAEYFTSLSNEILMAGTKESFHSQRRKRTQLEHHVHNLMITRIYQIYFVVSLVRVPNARLNFDCSYQRAFLKNGNIIVYIVSGTGKRNRFKQSIVIIQQR